MTYSAGKWTPSGPSYSNTFSNSMIVNEQLSEINAFIRQSSNSNVNVMLDMMNMDGSMLGYKIYPINGFNPRLFDNLCHRARFYLDSRGREVMFVPGIQSAVWLNSPEDHHVFIMNINYDKSIPVRFVNKKLNIDYNHKFEEIQLLKFYIFENYDQLLKEILNE